MNETQTSLIKANEPANVCYLMPLGTERKCSFYLVRKYIAERSKNDDVWVASNAQKSDWFGIKNKISQTDFHGMAMFHNNDRYCGYVSSNRMRDSTMRIMEINAQVQV